MHARLIRFSRLSATQVKPTAEIYQQDLLPALESCLGFEGVLLLADQNRGSLSTLTLWETEQDLKGSEQAAKKAREGMAEGFGGRFEPVIDRYEVVLQTDGPR